jgi:hypothetical protein
VYVPRIYAQIIAVVLIMVGVAGCGTGGGGGGGAEDAQAPSDAKVSVVKTIRVKETEFVLLISAQRSKPRIPAALCNRG